MKKIIAVVLWLLVFAPASAQGPIYLPVVWSNGMATPDPILRITDGTTVIDLLGWDSGFEMSDPYWNPAIAQYKSGGSYVNSGLAEGQRLVHKEYDNAVETIPLSVRGINQDKAIQTIRKLLQIARQASDYWTKPYEYDDVWLEARPACDSCLTGYARIVKMSIPELTNPYGQPFFSARNEAVMEGITLTIEREPLWRGTPPGGIVGPLYNLIKNPDFEHWNNGITDSQPDNWTDLETIQITGQNNREATSPNSGNYALKIRVSGSTLAGRIKGVSQVIDGIKNNTEYTVIAWVRSDGVSNGVGRILVTYSGQLELYRSADRHGWKLYTGKFTTGTNNVVAVNLEILTTAANTDGTIYIDSLMLLEGDWETEAENGTLPYMSSSHITNHWDTGAGDINYVDVWNIPGDDDALTRLEIMNNTGYSDASNPIEKIATIRVGQRRAQDVFNFDNNNDPDGLPSASCSNNSYVSTALNSSWQTVNTKIITSPEKTADNQGRFRLLARIYDTKASAPPTVETRVSYFIGEANIANKTLNPAASPIIGNWHIVDLTPNVAMILDRKFSSLTPSQLGYSIEMKRTVGTGDAYLDYALTMPTDGGYLKANITPSLGDQNSLIVDNTNSQSISGTYGIVGWYTLYNTGLDLIPKIIVFNGNIYAAAYANGTGQRIFRKTPEGNWTAVFSVGGVNATVWDMEIHNGRLYAVVNDPGPATGSLYSTADGINWTLHITSAAITTTYGLKSFNGLLYIATSGSVVTEGIYTWDGTVLTHVYNLEGLNGNIPFRFAIYMNRLYVGTQRGGVGSYVYVYDPNAGWSRSFFTASSVGIFSLEVFRGYLYGGALNGPIVRYDGYSWTIALDVSSSLISVYKLQTFYDKLYIGGDGGTGIAAPVLQSTDGLTWTTIYDPAGRDIRSMEPYGNQLLVGVGATGAATIQAFGVFTTEYAVSDYQGGPFTSPPTKRHRWFFSFDRENYINVISDKVIIGLGYVPRYLTLRGAD